MTGAASGPAEGGAQVANAGGPLSGANVPFNYCSALGYIVIPDASPNGVNSFPPTFGLVRPHAFQNTFCGGAFGITGSVVPSALTCKC